ncbi:MAG: hypothetical protein ACTSW1_00235 [Candidatus Hodarchaeales archaeon]
MDAIEFYKDKYCRHCPMETQCSQTKIALFYCMLEEQIRLTTRLKKLENEIGR